MIRMPSKSVHLTWEIGAFAFAAVNTLRGLYSKVFASKRIHSVAARAFSEHEMGPVDLINRPISEIIRHSLPLNPPNAPPEVPLTQVDSNPLNKAKKVVENSLKGISWLPSLPPLIPPALYRRYIHTEKHLYNIDLHIDAPPTPTIFEISLENRRREAFTIKLEVGNARPIRVVTDTTEADFHSMHLAPSLFNNEENLLKRIFKAVIKAFKELKKDPAKAVEPEKRFWRHTEFTIFVRDRLYSTLEPSMKPKIVLIPLSNYETMVVVQSGTENPSIPVNRVTPSSTHDIFWDLGVKREYHLDQPFDLEKKRKEVCFPICPDTPNENVRIVYS